MSLRYICDIGLDCLGSGGDIIDGPMGIRGSIVGLCSLMDVVQMDYAMWLDICLIGDTNLLIDLLAAIEHTRGVLLCMANGFISYLVDRIVITNESACIRWCISLPFCIA
jgi:hypothetical protein